MGVVAEGAAVTAALRASSAARTTRLELLLMIAQTSTHFGPPTADGSSHLAESPTHAAQRSTRAVPSSAQHSTRV